MSKRDYYEILGLSREATDSDLKKAYRQLARTYHPDVNKEPEAEKIFKEISEAYGILSDPQQRARYDRFGHAGVGAGAGGGGFSGAEGFGFGGLGDIFEAFFGGRDPFQQGGRRRSGPERGSDLRIDLEVNFREAIFGTEKEIQIQHLEACQDCNGMGAQQGTEVGQCPMCRGSGQIQQHQRTAFGTFTNITVCPKCQGEGVYAANPCSPCKGQGRLQKKKNLKVKIPAGVDSGIRLCVNGEGDVGVRGGHAGDLYIVLHTLPDQDGHFERRGQDLFSRIALRYSQAVLGDQIQAQTMEGMIAVDIPAGTQPGTIFKLKNKGVPFLNNPTSRGDLLLQVEIAVPTKISAEERHLLDGLHKLETHTPHGSGFSFTEDGGLEHGDHTQEKPSFFEVLKNTWKGHRPS